MSTAREFTEHELIARYAPRVNYLGRCWIWEGRTNNWGYGIVSKNQSRIPAHRLFYELLVGPIPEGMVIDHICRNHLCVNPAHLQPVTHGENVALGRTRNTHCTHGHSLEDAYINSKGHRMCKPCVTERNRANYSKRKEGVNASSAD